MLTNSEWACTIIRTFIYVQNGIEIKKKKRQTKKMKQLTGAGGEGWWVDLSIIQADTYQIKIKDGRKKKKWGVKNTKIRKNTAI